MAQDAWVAPRCNARGRARMPSCQDSCRVITLPGAEAVMRVPFTLRRLEISKQGTRTFARKPQCSKCGTQRPRPDPGQPLRT